MECKHIYIKMSASFEETSPLSNFAHSGRRELTRLAEALWFPAPFCVTARSEAAHNVKVGGSRHGYNVEWQHCEYLSSNSVCSRNSLSDTQTENKLESLIVVQIIWQGFFCSSVFLRFLSSSPIGLIKLFELETVASSTEIPELWHHYFKLCSNFASKSLPVNLQWLFVSGICKFLLNFPLLINYAFLTLDIFVTKLR